MMMDGIKEFREENPDTYSDLLPKKISGCRANVRIRLYLFCGNNVIVTFNSFNCYFSMKIWLG